MSQTTYNYKHVQILHIVQEHTLGGFPGFVKAAIT